MGFLALMAFMAPGWWVLTVGYIIWSYILSDKESWGWIVTCFTIYILYWIFLSGLNVFEYVTEHPFVILISVGIHFFGGFIWSFPRWWLYVNEKAEQARKDKAYHLQQHGPNKPKSEDGKVLKEEQFSKEQLSTYMTKLKKTEEEWHSSCTYDGPPKAMNNINRIVTWIIYWEFSIIKSLLQDILVRFWRQIVLKFSKVYQKMSDKAFVGLEKRERS